MMVWCFVAIPQLINYYLRAIEACLLQPRLKCGARNFSIFWGKLVVFQLYFSILFGVQIGSPFVGILFQYQGWCQKLWKWNLMQRQSLRPQKLQSQQQKPLPKRKGGKRILKHLQLRPRKRPSELRRVRQWNFVFATIAKKTVWDTAISMRVNTVQAAAVCTWTLEEKISPNLCAVTIVSPEHDVFAVWAEATSQQSISHRSHKFVLFDDLHPKDLNASVFLGKQT